MTEGTGEVGLIVPWVQELFPESTSIWCSGGRGEPPSSDIQQGEAEGSWKKRCKCLNAIHLNYCTSTHRLLYDLI